MTEHELSKHFRHYILTEYGRQQKEAKKMTDIKVEVGKLFVNGIGDIIKIIDYTQDHLQEKLSSNIQPWLGLNINKMYYVHYWDGGRHDFKEYSLVKEYQEELKIGWVYETDSSHVCTALDFKIIHYDKKRSMYVGLSHQDHLEWFYPNGKALSWSLKCKLKLETGRPEEG